MRQKSQGKGTPSGEQNTGGGQKRSFGTLCAQQPRQLVRVGGWLFYGLVCDRWLLAAVIFRDNSDTKTHFRGGNTEQLSLTTVTANVRTTPKGIPYLFRAVKFRDSHY